jgi:hypothetical protein
MRLFQAERLKNVAEVRIRLEVVRNPLGLNERFQADLDGSGWI